MPVNWPTSRTGDIFGIGDIVRVICDATSDNATPQLPLGAEYEVTGITDAFGAGQLLGITDKNGKYNGGWYNTRFELVIRPHIMAPNTMKQADFVGDGFYVGDIVELTSHGLAADKGAQAKVIGPGEYPDTMKIEWLDDRRKGQQNGGYSIKIFRKIYPQNQEQPKKVDYFAITKGIIGR